jgi:methyl-accepting chemotaxis protein
MDTIFTEINDMSSSFTAVNQAVEEQSQGSSQMLNALKSVQEMTGEVQKGASFIHKQSADIHKEIELLRQISMHVTEKVNEMRLSSANIASFLENAKELAQSKSE